MWLRRQLLAASVFLLPVSAWTAPIPASEYVFVRDLDRWVGVLRGEWVLVGKLDADGNFKEHYQYRFGSGTSLIPMHAVINVHPIKRRPVYELRSFRLIKGVMMPGGRFVPDPGDSVLTFEEYKSKYTPASVPIWNLPGYFKKVEKPMDTKDGKE